MEVLVGRGLRLASVLGSSPCFVAKSLPKSLSNVRASSSQFGRFNLSEDYPCHRILSYDRTSHLNTTATYKRPFEQNINNNGAALARYCTSQPPLKEDGKDAQKEPVKNVSLLQKMKQMTKDYWYILIPVHLVTSAGWMTVFYMTAKKYYVMDRDRNLFSTRILHSGVDIATLMEYMHLNENYVQTIRNSSAGNWALAYLLYKIFTPIRYTVTVGGTTMVVSKLNKRGLLKVSELKKGIKEHREMKKTSAKSTGEVKPDNKMDKTDAPKS